MGTAAVNISPPAGTPMAGYYHARGSESVIDDLYAKAAVLDDGDTKVALVLCDLITLPRKMVLDAPVDRAADGISAATSTAAVRHAHAYRPGLLASDSVRDHLDKGSSDRARTCCCMARRLPRRRWRGGDGNRSL